MAKEALSALLSKSEAENQLYLGFIFVDSANTYHVGGILQGGMLSIFTPALYDRAYWSLYNSGQDVRGIAAIFVTHYRNMPGGVPETLANPEKVTAHNYADTQRGIYSAMTVAQVGFPQRLGARLKICALAICAGSLLIGQPAKAQSVPLPDIGETAAIAMADHAIARLWERANRKMMAKHLGAVRLDLYPR